MPWTNGAIWAVAGGVCTWLSGLAKAGWEHWLKQREARHAEARTIRAEEREQAKAEAERRRIEKEQLLKDEATLLLYKTQIRSFGIDIFQAASIVNGIHNFFDQHPQYLSIKSNVAFLRRYPRDMERFVANYDPTDKTFSLAQIMSDARDLHVIQDQ